VKIALLSIDASYCFEDRLKRIEELLPLAAAKGARLALLPELCYGGYTIREEEFAGHTYEDSIKFFSAMALKNKIAIGYGVAKKTTAKYKNSYLIMSQDGELLVDYDKMHVFSFANEHSVFEGGNQLVSFTLDEISFGLSICYDIRFPEIFSLYSSECDAILCPAAWPKKRVSNFKLLLKCRALENMISIIGINWQGISKDGMEYIKSSNVATAKGSFKKPIFSQNEIDIYEVEKREKHKKLPDTVNDKRFSLYADLYRQKAKKC
jgi:omega-amidase